jgi:hypothetical protein
MEIFHLGPLFEEVQMSNLLGDGKAFPDCLPKRPLEEINTDYLQKRNLPILILSYLLKIISNYRRPIPQTTKAIQPNPQNYPSANSWRVVSNFDFVFSKCGLRFGFEAAFFIIGSLLLFNNYRFIVNC